MQNRKEIKSEISHVRKQIADLEKKEMILCKKYLTVSDTKTWYTEINRKIRDPKNGRKFKTILEGRVHWYQNFKDEDTRKIVKIERSCAIMQDGIWDIELMKSMVK